MGLGVLRKWWARMALGAATLGGTVALLASPDDLPLDAKGVVAVVLAALAWAFSEIPEQQPHPHDIALGQAFDSFFTPPVRYMLKDVSFGDPVPDTGALRLFDFADNWTGSKYEFDDKVLNAEVQGVWVDARALVDLIVINMVPMNGNSGYRTVKTADDIACGRRSADTVAAAKAMDEKATELFAKVENMDRLMRKRLRMA